MHATKQTALKRIHTLFYLAKEAIHENPEQAQRYVHIARHISMTTKVRIPTELKHQICKHCKKYIQPGINCRIRIQQRREPHIVITCLHCGGHIRYPLKNRRKKTNHAKSKNETQNKA